MLGLLGQGGSALVFAAHQRHLSERFGVERKIALKLMWDLEKARHELERLSQLDANRGANNLIDYFETPTEKVTGLLEPLLSLLPNTEVFANAKFIGVLVLQLAYGQNIIRTEPAAELSTKNIPYDAWEIVVDGQAMIQYPVIEMDFEERVQFLKSLIQILEEAHEQVPPQVHGDLHPGNIVYNRADRQVMLLDWGSKDTCGVGGWISPWHDQFLLNEISALPPEADVFVVNLWIQRLLKPKLKNKIESIRIPSSGIDSMLKLRINFDQIVKPHQRHKPFYAMISFLLFFVLLYVVLKPKAYVDPEMESIDRLIAYALRSDEDGRSQLKELNDKLLHEKDSNLREELIRGIARIKVAKNPVSHPFLASIDFSKPNAIMFSDRQ